MPGEIQVRKRLSGFLLEDICSYVGFAAVPKEVKQRFCKGMDLQHFTPVLSRQEAKEVMAFCFYLLGVPVVDAPNRSFGRVSATKVARSFPQ